MLESEAKTQNILAHHAAITDKQKEVSVLERDWQTKKDASLAAKKAYDAAAKELLDLIAEGPDKQLKLNFDSGTVVEQKPKAKSGEVVAPKSLPKWAHDLDIGSVSSIPPKTLEKIIAAGVTTFADLMQLLSGQQGAKAIKGLSAKAAEKLMEVYGSIIEENSKPKEPAKETATEEPAAGLRIAKVEDDERSESVSLSTPGWDDLTVAPTPLIDEPAKEESESSASEDTSSDEYEDRYQLLVDIEGMEPRGFVKGATLKGFTDSDSVWLVGPDGSECHVTPDEYQVVRVKKEPALQNT